MSAIENLETVTEDTIQCLFFSTLDNSNLNSEQLCESVNKTIRELSQEHIWHRDEFKVHIPLASNGGKELMPQLMSITCFGDNIEDEWFIVYLILEITKKHTNLIVQVTDNDGEFLLIEAADRLPNWANPDIINNRVFVYQNNIHVIPPSLADTDAELGLEEAIKLVVDNAEETKSPAVYAAILKRIEHYPDKIKETIHRAIVKLPKDIATLLTLEPSLVSPIVSSYCNHDMIDARSCKNVEFKDCVIVPIKFTKCLYAMLVHSKLIRSMKCAGRISENDKKSVLGLKLTCGYEMIMSKLSGDVFSTKEYAKFIKSLSDNGYFKDNIEGSKDYTILLEKAKEFYLSIECSINSYLCHKIEVLKNTKEFVSLRESIQNSQELEKNLIEDDDDWLNIHPDQLNDLLNSRYGTQPQFKKDDVITSETITKKLTSFLKETSDFEGIETNNENDDNNKIEFDSDLFMKSLNKMMKIIGCEEETTNANMDDDDDDMDDSDDIDDDDMDDTDTQNNQLDEEIKSKLLSDIIGAKDNQAIVSNMIESMKQEGGASGPTSNVLRIIGVNKTDVLDSDDDLE